MKKFSILLGSALVLGLSMTSCSDDKGVSVSEEKLTGKWNYSTSKFSGGGVSTDEEEYFGNQAGCAADYIEFMADGTLTQGDYFTSACDLSTSTGEWSLDGSTVTVTVDGSTTEYKVSSISGTKLKVVETYSESGFTFKETTTFVKGAAAN